MKPVKYGVAGLALLGLMAWPRESRGFYEPLRYRSNDPFVFCTQGLDPERHPAPCWKPMPPYTGAYLWLPHCKPPNYKTGRDWTFEELDSFQQYMRVCPAAMKSGGWKGPGRAEDSPYTH